MLSGDLVRVQLGTLAASSLTVFGVEILRSLEVYHKMMAITSHGRRTSLARSCSRPRIMWGETSNVHDFPESQSVHCSGL